MLGKVEGKRRREWQRMRWSDSVTDSMDMNMSKLREMVKDKEAWRAVAHGVTKSQRQPSDETNYCGHYFMMHGRQIIDLKLIQ